MVPSPIAVTPTPAVPQDSDTASGDKSPINMPEASLRPEVSPDLSGTGLDWGEPEIIDVEERLAGIDMVSVPQGSSAFVEPHPGHLILARKPEDSNCTLDELRTALRYLVRDHEVSLDRPDAFDSPKFNADLEAWTALAVQYSKATWGGRKPKYNRGAAKRAAKNRPVRDNPKKKRRARPQNSTSQQNSHPCSGSTSTGDRQNAHGPAKARKLRSDFWRDQKKTVNNILEPGGGEECHIPPKDVEEEFKKRYSNPREGEMQSDRISSMPSWMEGERVL